MKKQFIAGLIGFITMFGFIFIGCSEPEPDLGNDILKTPLNVTAIADSSNSIIISWSPVEGAKGYYVYDVAFSSNNIVYYNYEYSTKSTSFTNTGLKANTSYSYRVRAYNDKGKSIFSEKVSATTFMAASNTPANVSASAESESSIKIEWSAVDRAEGYKIYRGDTSAGPYIEIGETDSTSYTDSSLPINIKYYYKVSSYNISGESVQSSSVFAQATGIPEPPSNITATGESSTSIRIEWANVSNAVSYIIYRSLTESGNYTELGITVNTSYTNTGLDPETIYYYKVSSRNGRGDSYQPDSVSAVTLSGKPNAPASLSVSTSYTTKNSIRINWSLVSGASYIVYRSLTNTDDYKQIAEISSSYTTNFTDKDLTPETTYYYKVAASNNYGVGPMSTAVSVTTMSGKPNVPAILSISAVFYNITIDWDYISSAIDYKIYRSTSASGEYIYLSSTTSRSYKDYGLNAGTTYYYKVSASNEYGDSALSAYRSAATFAANAGTTPSNAIEIPHGTAGIGGDFPNNLDEVWYKFTRTGGGVLYANDSGLGFDGIGLGDIIIDVYGSEGYGIIINGVPIKDIDIGKGINDTNNIGAGNWDGTFYVLVKPKTNNIINKRPFKLFFVAF